ncbi:hypothetical protein DYB32_004776 [Aphanomyces invadans]|uniref:PUM-HD domain-containing protein n=1 Tax=Aphanomyces invadans TaxID=157072 RepID=A0A418AWK3_9STRA|nr:hypothetical protein DYB32_004776 [Aphanomyces invadans]
MRRVRPRRLEPDTLSYLEEVNESFVQNLKDGDVETSRMLLWNVLEEIAPRIASAASDRHACAYIEVLVDHMSAQQLRFFLHKMEGYFSHLWTNRYSSHVLQRVLSKVGAMVENEVKGETTDDDDDDRAAGVPEMATLVVTMCAEVQNEWLTLINDVSASHVMRAVFCALAGRAPVVEKRGKKGKHKALQFQANPSDAASGSTEVPAAFQDTLAEMLELVLASSDGKLMELMSDSHAGPVLSMAVRVAPASIQSKVIFKLLKWNDEERSKQRFYDFAGDSVCHSCDEDVWAAVFERCLQGRLLEFAEHAISNFVVQNFIQRTPTPEFAETVLDELQGALWSLLSMHRAGVIWRLAELCVRFKLREKSFFLALVAGVEKLESAKPEPARRDVVSALIGLQLSNNQVDDAKLALYEKLKGQFGSLVLDRNGSFTVLKCFDVMPLAEKTAIVDELAAVDGKLAGSHFASMKKVKELFSDFLGDESNKRKPNKSADDDAPRTSKKAKRAKKEKI